MKKEVGQLADELFPQVRKAVCETRAEEASRSMAMEDARKEDGGWKMEDGGWWMEGGR